MYKNHIVLTTINYPKLLLDYRSNLERYGHLFSVCVWVIGDKKTPDYVHELCNDLSDMGLKTVFVDVEFQLKWGKRFPKLFHKLPWNNETRRNIGYLLALENGCERLISIDDDNWPTDDDFIGRHSITGTKLLNNIINEKKGFHNVCEYLDYDNARQIFPRGYPLNLRLDQQQNEPTHIPPKKDSIIGVVSGLWLNKPDIDAITWLNGRINSIGYNGPEYFVLDQQTWSPINTQNTSIVRNLVPAFFCIPMGWNVPGGRIQRYGDIWGGYFLQAIMKESPYYVAFGKPIVEHQRNPHNYVDDLRYEYWGIILTDWLTDLIKNEFSPQSSSIIDRMNEFNEFLKANVFNRLPSWCPDEISYFFKNMTEAINEWLNVCEEIL